MTKPASPTPDMPPQLSSTHCPRCNEVVSGRFCTGCGTSVRELACASCGVTTPAGARFCPDCGAAAGAAARSSSATVRPTDRLPGLIGAAALLALAAFVAGVVSGRRSSPSGDIADQTATTPLGPMQAGGFATNGGQTAPDISNMSPEERASRLFNRVMLYSEQGKLDSARFFAPMAIQAYEMIGPVDAHAQYDIGVISAAAGDVNRARAEADTILAARPTHLLGLVLAIHAADLRKDAVAASDFRRRLVAAAPTERTALKEYAEHARDIDDALTKAAGAR
ncbi:MAG: zinc ribbon domain-containing protein [bacterium]